MAEGPRQDFPRADGQDSGCRQDIPHLDRLAAVLDDGQILDMSLVFNIMMCTAMDTLGVLLGMGLPGKGA